jgi:hypothetical protein
MKHTCSVCLRPRSRAYHQHHPLTSGQTPTPGICSRCIRREVTTRQEIAYPEAIICEVHHYHHIVHCESSMMNEAPSVPPKDELPTYTELPTVSPIELSAENSHNGHQKSYRGSMLGDQPPPVRRWTKPNLIKFFSLNQRCKKEAI